MMNVFVCWLKAMAILSAVASVIAAFFGMFALVSYIEKRYGETKALILTLGVLMTMLSIFLTVLLCANGGHL